jgi:hypothetical protein
MSWVWISLFLVCFSRLQKFITCNLLISLQFYDVGPNCQYFYSQVVLTAMLACALAKPGFLAGGISSLAVASIAAPLGAAPIATPLTAASIAAPLAAAPIAAPLAAAPIATPLAAASIATPLAAASIAAPLAAVPIATPLAAQSKYHIQDAIGQASYGHAEPLQTHNAIQVRT